VTLNVQRGEDETVAMKKEFKDGNKQIILRLRGFEVFPPGCCYRDEILVVLVKVCLTIHQTNRVKQNNVDQF
jgi:hypothetical protein